MNNWGSIILVVLLAVTACASADPSDSWCVESLPNGEKIGTSPDPCSSARSVPPSLSSVTQGGFCIECTPRCGAIEYPLGSEFSDEKYFTDTDLPAGACIYEGEKCDMAATAPLSNCNGPVVGCALNAYRCTCTHGEWRCVMTSQGGGMCVCYDAGVLDASG